MDPWFLLYAIRTRRLWEFYRVVRERFDMSNCSSKNSKNINKSKIKHNEFRQYLKEKELGEDQLVRIIEETTQCKKTH